MNALDPDEFVNDQHAIISFKFASILLGMSPFATLCPEHALDVVFPEDEKIIQNQPDKQS